MKTNRRDLLKAAAGVPVVFASGTLLAAAEKPSKPEKFSKLEHIADLPLRSGKVIGMVQYRDDIFIATEHGGIYRLFDLL